MFPRVVHAALKANCVCEHAVDNVGSVISQQDVKSFTGSRKKDVLFAEGVMNRMSELMARTKPDVDASIEISDMDVELVISMCGKDPNKRTMTQVADAFFARHFGNASSETPRDVPDAPQRGRMWNR